MEHKNLIVKKELNNLYELSPREVFSYEENAELQSFYSSIKGVVDNIFEDGSVYITTIFLNLNSQGEPFGRYFFPKALRTLTSDPNYQSALDYLEGQHISLPYGNTKEDSNSTKH